MKPTNIKQAKELIKKYRSILLVDIERVFKEEFQYEEMISKNDISTINWRDNRIGFRIASKLTGFGISTTCTLCLSVINNKSNNNDNNTKINSNYRNCKKCIYGFESNSLYDNLFCLNDEHEKTYKSISNATSADDLLKAFESRAKHIEVLLIKIRK